MEKLEFPQKCFKFGPNRSSLTYIFGFITWSSLKTWKLFMVPCNFSYGSLTACKKKCVTDKVLLMFP